MAINAPIPHHDYVYFTDTEQSKDNIIQQAIDDNKEACYAGYGTGQLNSEYQPSPIKDADYYMQYCNSDNYDYLKDYRLVWGYGIGIVETDVIVNVDTGEHLAEGKDACDAYVAPEGVNTKRGIWLQFAGTNLINPNVIQSVILPDYIISIKNFTNNLTSQTLYIEQFNTKNIINWDNAFYQKYIYFGTNNNNITFDLSAARSMKYFNYNGSVNQGFDSAVLKIINHNNRIDLSYAFYQSKINILIDNLFLNYSGGEYVFYEAYINVFPEEFYIDVGNYCFYKTKNLKITSYPKSHFRILDNIREGFNNVDVLVNNNIDYSICNNIDLLFDNCTFTDTIDLSNFPNINVNNFIYYRRSSIVRNLIIKWPDIALTKYNMFINGFSENVIFSITFLNVCKCRDISNYKNNTAIIACDELKLNGSFDGINCIYFYSEGLKDESNILLNYTYTDVNNDIDKIENYFKDSNKKIGAISSYTIYADCAENTITCNYFPTFPLFNYFANTINDFITIDIKNKIFYYNKNGNGFYKLLINNNTIFKNVIQNSDHSNIYNTYVEYVLEDDEILNTPITVCCLISKGTNIDFNTYRSFCRIIDANTINIYYGDADVKQCNKIVFHIDVSYNDIISLDKNINCTLHYISNFIYLNFGFKDFTNEVNPQKINVYGLIDINNFIIESESDKELIYCYNSNFTNIPYSWINKYYISPETKAFYGADVNYINDTDNRIIESVNYCEICEGDFHDWTIYIVDDGEYNKNADLENHPCLFPNIIYVSIPYRTYYITLYANNTELTVINNSNIRNVSLDLGNCNKLHNLTVDFTRHSDNTPFIQIGNININNDITNVDIINPDNLKIDIYANYATKLSTDTINIFLSMADELTINEIVYAKLTEEQISTFVNGGGTLISIKNET